MERFSPIQKDEIMAKANTTLIQHTFAAGGVPVDIAHNLKRKPKVWRVANLSANAVVFGTADEVKLTLEASAPCTVTLEVV